MTSAPDTHEYIPLGKWSIKDKVTVELGELQDAGRIEAQPFYLKTGATESELTVHEARQLVMILQEAITRAENR